MEDRINIIDRINSEEKIFASSYYIVIHDVDKKSLQNTLNVAVQMLKSSNLEAMQLNNKQLALFIKYSYSNNFDEREFEKTNETDYISKSAPDKVSFKSTKVIQDGFTLTQFMITDYPLQVPNGHYWEIR